MKSDPMFEHIYDSNQSVPFSDWKTMGLDETFPLEGIEIEG